MRNLRYWILFVSCALSWLILSLRVAPFLSGEDVYIFRDAGWNLAAWGSFESAAGPYMHDLVPRFYAHYTPGVPLLFAGYASVFPRNAYAGTIFNLLLGLSIAAIAFWWVLRQPAGRLRNAVAWAVALLAPAFIAYDRPETAALILFSTVIILGANPRPRPVVAGTLIVFTFLVHPFAAIVASVWTLVLCVSHQWNRPRRWLHMFSYLATASLPIVLLLGAVAALYYSIDHDSLTRFAANALGVGSGIGVTLSMRSGKSFLNVLRGAIFGLPVTVPFAYLTCVFSSCMLAAWSFIHGKVLSHLEWLPIMAGLVCMPLAIFLFPYQTFYVKFVAFSIPIGLLIWSSAGARLATPALVMLLFALMSEVPSMGIGLIVRVEQRASFEAARAQPALLRAKLAPPDSVVVLAGPFYDLFKPKFRRLVSLDYLEDDVNHFADVAAVVNCYQAYHGESGPVVPFPNELNASEFYLIQPAPQHLWITLFGHRVMRGQWGYGCDLYVRNSAPPSTSSR